jgi:hypothetical protein
LQNTFMKQYKTPAGETGTIVEQDSTIEKKYVLLKLPPLEVWEPDRFIWFNIDDLQELPVDQPDNIGQSAASVSPEQLPPAADTSFTDQLNQENALLLLELMDLKTENARLIHENRTLQSNYNLSDRLANQHQI